MSAKARAGLLSLSLLLLIAAVIALTPQGRALAGEVLKFFTPAENSSFPVYFEHDPSIQSASTPEPTFVALVEPVEPEPSAAIQPTASQAGVSAAQQNDCEETDFSYRCQIARAEAEAGFDAREFPADPSGLVFDSAQASSGALVAVDILYSAIGGGGELHLRQGLGDFPVQSEWAAVPAEAVEAVQVGALDGEYVRGHFAVKEGTSTAAWKPDMPVWRLRWRDEDRWFELGKMGDPVPIEWLDREALIALAASLVPSPEGDGEALRADYLTSVADAEKLAGFDLKEPSVLPQGFVFSYAQYDNETMQVQLVYELDGQVGIAGLRIYQTPLSAGAELTSPQGYRPEGAWEVVQVGGALGFYTAGIWEAAPAPEGTPTPGPTPTKIWRPDHPTRTLAWEADGLIINILFDSSRYYGGRLEKEEMIEIAESMK